MSVGSAYPVRVDATLDQGLSRWLWLVKWLLAVPHYLVLFVLWMAFVVVSVGAFFAILFTGRYPPSLFEFNVGVLRWSWRVAYYSYGALGTDRYPPFTLAEVPDYPAHLEIDYPEHLSRGLVLVKWWLLAIPQYLIVAVFAGGGAWAAWQTDRNAAGWGGGLIGLLVLIAAVVLTVTGRYPRQIFDFVLGLNRWVLRVAAYAALMTDQYPPFRLDMGGHEALATMTVPRPPGAGPGTATAASSAPSAATLLEQPGPPAPPASLLGQPGPSGPPAPPAPPGPPAPSSRPIRPTGPPPAGGWTALRIVSVVAGCLMVVISLGLLAAGGAASWMDNTQRDAAGYLTSDPHPFVTSGYAITSDRIDLGTSGVVAPASFLGTIRFTVTGQNPTPDVFVGIAPRVLADRYLAGVARSVVTDWTGDTTGYRQQAGGPPLTPPTDSRIWVASATGSGTQTLTWKPTSGDWLVVVMNRDATPGLVVTATAGATIPSLGWIAGGLFAAGGILLLGGAVLVILPVVRTGRRPDSPRRVP